MSDSNLIPLTWDLRAYVIDRFLEDTSFDFTFCEWCFLKFVRDRRIRLTDEQVSYLNQIFKRYTGAGLIYVKNPHQ